MEPWGVMLGAEGVIWVRLVRGRVRRVVITMAQSSERNADLCEWTTQL